MTILVRPFIEADIPQLWEMMRALAEFEDYLEDFRVTQADIARYGLGEKAIFGALIAHSEGSSNLLGMAVHYTIPYTYDLRPTLVLKELFVDGGARGMGVGSALFQGLRELALSRQCGCIDWCVMAGNEKAEAFYRQMGGQPDPKWENWTLPL